MKEADVWFNNGNELYRLGKYNEAIECYENALSLNIKNYGENHPNTYVVYEKLKELFHILKEKGERLYFDKKYDDAIKFYEKAVYISLGIMGDRHKENSNLFNQIADVYYLKSDFDNAIEYYEKSVNCELEFLNENTPFLAQLYNSIGMSYYSKILYDKAIEYYDKSLNIRLEILDDNSTSTATLYNNIGTCYYNKNQFDKAIYYYSKSLSIRLELYDSSLQDIATLYNNIAFAYDSKREMAIATDYFLKAIKIYNDIGVDFCNKLGYDHALEFHEKALRLCLDTNRRKIEEVSVCYDYMGNVHLKKGDNNKAMECYEKAFEIRLDLYGEYSKHIIPSYKNLGHLFEILGAYEEAIFYFDRILDIEPENVFAIGHKSGCLTNLGAYEEAIIYYDKVLELDSKYNDTKIEMTILSKRKTIIEFDKILNKEPKNIEILLKKGIALFQIEEYKEANKCFDSILKIESEIIDALYYKGLVLEKLREYKKAIKFYKKVLSIQPNHKKAYQSLTKERCPKCLSSEIEEKNKESDDFLNTKRVTVYRVCSNCGHIIDSYKGFLL